MALTYKLRSLEVVSNGPGAAQLVANVNITDSNDTDLSTPRSVAIPLAGARLTAVNNLLDDVAAALGARIPGNPAVTR